MCNMLQKDFSIKRTAFTVGISYQQAGEYHKEYDVDKAMLVQSLLEQYLKDLYGTQYQASYLSTLALFADGNVLNGEKRLEECGLEKNAELICSTLPKTPSPKEHEDINIIMMFNSDFSTGRSMRVLRNTPLSSVRDDYLV